MRPRNLTNKASSDRCGGSDEEEMNSADSCMFVHLYVCVLTVLFGLCTSLSFRLIGRTLSATVYI